MPGPCGRSACVPAKPFFGRRIWSPRVGLGRSPRARAYGGALHPPGGGLTAELRCNIILRYRPTVLATLPSQLLRIGRVMQDMGEDPRKTSVTRLFTGGEPAAGVASTRQRLEDMWDAELVEFYGCTEVSPHCGGYSCEASHQQGKPVHTHLLEDIQAWELVDPDTMEPVADGERGVTVVTNMNSESSSQLRFVVGDYTVFDRAPCDCGRTHVRAIGGFQGRADDLINLRGIKFYPSGVEEGVRAVAGVGNEYEVIFATNGDGIDTMNIRVEHADHGKPGHVVNQVKRELQSRIEVRFDVEVLPPDTFPKTEFKAKRIRDERVKS